MYCSSCGARLQDGAAFCSQCGAAQGRRGRSTARDVWTILSLIFLGPIGLIVMWAASGWSRAVKLALTGLIFPPLWILLPWEWKRLPAPIRIALTAIAIAGLTAIVATFAEATPAIVVLVISTILALAYILSNPDAKPVVDTTIEDLRRDITAKLEACHDLIASIEDTLSLHPQTPATPVQQAYVHALETRSRAMDLFEHAETERQLIRADRQASAAFEALSASRDAVARAITESP